MSTDSLIDIPQRLKDRTHCTAEQYEQLYAHSISDPEGFWAEQASTQLEWFSPWKQVLQYDYSQAEIQWFIGGKLNVSHNCIDRHLATRADKTAIIWEGNEPGEVRQISYRELHAEVCRIANVLKAHGVERGDRVALYMPMVPELAYAMLACARIGAVHTVIFAGFSAESIRDRLLDCSCKVVITANEALRATKKIALKKIVDQALEGVTCVQSVLVFLRTSAHCEMKDGRDFWLEGEMAKVPATCKAEELDSEDPLFILYTSGSTGKPKGVLHTQAGYLLYAAVTHRYVFDCHEDDIYFCAADCGWVTGHSYVVYGPLANGATTLMFESTPLYPDAGRYWDVIDRHKVTIFYTAPTAIRSVEREGDEWVTKYDRSTLRILGSVGEPINEDAWLWYYNLVGRGQCAVVDTWWQTETGGILITPLPGATKMRPGYATRPFFGVQPIVVDDQGNEIIGNDVQGRLCIKFPWPGQMRTVFGDHQRFFDTYFSQFPGRYFTGDGCIRDQHGYYRITGRVDDVLNVSGHRIGTAELESAIISSGIVVEAAVVGVPHEIKGTGIFAYCIAAEGVQLGIEAEHAVHQAVRRVIGGFATPDTVQFVPGLPKTRSGKIMRRILRKIAEGIFEDFGDTSTLAEPAVVDQILSAVRQSTRILKGR